MIRRVPLFTVLFDFTCRSSLIGLVFTFDLDRYMIKGGRSFALGRAHKLLSVILTLRKPLVKMRSILIILVRNSDAPSKRSSCSEFMSSAKTIFLIDSPLNSLLWGSIVIMIQIHDRQWMKARNFHCTLVWSLRIMRLLIVPFTEIWLISFLVAWHVHPVSWLVSWLVGLLVYISWN